MKDNDQPAEKPAPLAELSEEQKANMAGRALEGPIHKLHERLLHILQNLRADLAGKGPGP